MKAGSAPEPVKAPDPAGDAEGHSALGPGRIAWLVLKNTVVQAGSRVFVALSKYLGYILIARVFGTERFGEFSLVLTLLVFAETILDFGYGEIVVRDICQTPSRKRPLLIALTTTKGFQVVLTYGMLVAALAALGYPSHILWAGILAGTELLFFGVILIYRVLYKANLSMERDGLAEFAGTAVFIALLILVCMREGTLSHLFQAYLAGRAVYFTSSYLLGRRDFDVFTCGRDYSEVRPLFIKVLPFGLCMFTAILFNSQDMVMLSKMDGIHAVGIYSFAYRFVHPLVGVSVSLMSALFPILSSCWERRMDRFANIYQRGFDYSCVLGGAVFCGIQASAAFLISLWGPEAMEAVGVMRVLGGAIAVFYISSMVGPMFIVMGRRWLALGLGCAGITINFVLNLLLIPQYSYVGAAVATILTEVFLMLPALWMIQRSAGFLIKIWVLLRVIACCALTLGVVYQAGLWDTFAGGALAAMLYGVAVLLTGTVRPRELVKLLSIAKRGQ